MRSRCISDPQDDYPFITNAMLINLQKRLIARAEKKGIPPWQAEEMALDAILVIGTKYAHVGEVTELVKIAFGILRKKIAKYYRIERSIIDATITLEEAEGLYSAQLHLKLMDECDFRESIRQMIAELRPEWWIVLHGYYLEGKTLEQIRAELHVASTNTVASWKHRAVATIRHKLLDG